MVHCVRQCGYYGRTDGPQPWLFGMITCRLRWPKTVPRLLPVLLLAAGANSGSAQIVLDGTFGTSGALTGPQYAVTADLGLTRGGNLFHSFARFDLKAGDVAAFTGPVGLQNILNRVTGGGPSTIDGTIRSEVAGANFFFINPNGVMFGPGAVVDVSGSFAASTANYLKLADGARFVAALDADDSMLSTAPVAAFGFLNGAHGSIEVRGALTVAPNSTLSLVGGSVSVSDGADLEAIEGSIDLIGVRGSGELPFSRDTPLPGSGATAGLESVVGDGTVVIRGGRLVVNNARISTSTTGGDIDIALSERMEVVNGGQVTTRNSGALSGGNIVIEAHDLVIDGLDEPVATRIAAETFGDDPQGSGGGIVLNAASLELRRGAEISVSTFGAADAGRMEINTSLLRLEGSDAPEFPTQISANAAPVIGSASGAGGRIVIRSEVVEVLNGAGILAATSGDADAGGIEISAETVKLSNGAVTTFTAGAGAGGEIRIESDALTLDGPFASITALTTGANSLSAAGNGGVINLAVKRLRVQNDAAISANTFGNGDGGNINISADAMLLDTATFQPGSIPGVTAASHPSFFGSDGGGKGGDVTIVAGSLSIRDGMVISTTTSTSGDGGNVHIRAGTVELEAQSSIQAASIGTGRAGTISLESGRDVRMTGNSAVSTSAPLSSGGDIRVEAGREIRLVDSGITAQAGPGGGGNISLMAPSLIYLLNATLTAQADGDGGNLSIDPVFFILNRGALISKSTSANGGNITIRSDYFLQSDSLIDASAPFGLPGTVQVSAPDADLRGSLLGLPGNLLDVESQLRPDCAVRSTEGISSFVVLGRGGLPLQPGGFVPRGIASPLDEKE
jgi:filamentous hemagglutinin family protein